MKSVTVRILSAFMCVILLFSALSITVFARDGKEVVASGFCGERFDGEVGRNLIWTYYSTKELVVGGEGAMDWYLTAEENQKPQPWHDYLPEVETITVENGVTSIGSYAFRLQDGYSGIGSMALKRVNIAGSVSNIDTTAFYNTAFGRIKPAIVYEGSKEDWERINRFSYRYEFVNGEWVHKNFARAAYSEPKAFKMFYNNQSPESFCNIKNSQKYVAENLNYSFTTDYYILNEGETLIWELDGSGAIISCENDAYGMPESVKVSGYDRGNSVLTVRIVNKDGKIISSDSVNITSAKIARDDSIKVIFQKLFTAFSNISAGIQLSGIFALMYAEMYLAAFAEVIINIFR